MVCNSDVVCVALLVSVTRQGTHLDGFNQLIVQDQQKALPRPLRVLDQAPLKKALPPLSLKVSCQLSTAPLHVLSTPLHPLCTIILSAGC